MPPRTTVTRRISLAPGEGPSGLAIDVKGKKLFSVCGGSKTMAVTDIPPWKVVATPAIGAGPDAAGFDPGHGPGVQLQWRWNADHRQAVNGKYDVVDTVTTERGARTMAVDDKTHKVYLLAAEYGPAPAAQGRQEGPPAGPAGQLPRAGGWEVIHSEGEVEMKKSLAVAFVLAMLASADGPYKVLKTAKVGGDGGFDYVYADEAGRRLYIPRTGAECRASRSINLDTLASVGEIPNANARGAAVDPKNHHGFGSSKPVVMWDTKTLATIKTIDVQGGPDGIHVRSVQRARLGIQPQPAERHGDRYQGWLGGHDARPGRSARAGRHATARATSMSIWKTRTRSLPWTPRL